jgi:hypothetical protein
MSKLRILIIGDSFAADWSAKYTDYPGWPNLLAKKYSVTNLAQAGVSEYKIYKQLVGVNNLNDYDLVIVSHTSPLRVHTRKHPVHYKDVLHANADLMLVDIEYHYHKLKNFFNSALRSAYKFFLHHYDVEYFEITYKLLRTRINDILKGKKVIVISSLPYLEEFITEDIVLNFQFNKGLINHATKELNEQIFLTIDKTIDQLSNEDKIMEEPKCQ